MLEQQIQTTIRLVLLCQRIILSQQITHSAAQIPLTVKTKFASPDQLAGNRSTLSECSASPRFHEGRLDHLRLDGKRPPQNVSSPRSFHTYNPNQPAPHTRGRRNSILSNRTRMASQASMGNSSRSSGNSASCFALGFSPENVSIIRTHPARWLSLSSPK